MTTPTLIVAANGYTRDHIAIALNRAGGGSSIVTYEFDGTGYRPVPLGTVTTMTLLNGTIRFVTDNDLDDGVLQVVDDARLD